MPSTHFSASSVQAEERMPIDSSSVARHQRDVDVQLERARQAADGDGGVVADHLRGDLRADLADHGVDLAGHDRRALLQLGQGSSAEPGARARPHPAQVVGDLGQRDRDDLEGARDLHQGVAVGLGLEVVERGGDLESGLAGEEGANALRELGVRVQARARGSAAEGDLAEALERAGDAIAAEGDLRGVAAELLAQRDGDGVHEVGAPGLDHVLELLGLGGQRGLQAVEGGQQALVIAVERRQVHGRGEHVVRRLAQVDVVVRMDAVAGQRGDDLVGVRVRGRAGARLEDVDRELVVVLAGGRPRRRRRRCAPPGRRRGGRARRSRVRRRP